MSEWDDGYDELIASVDDFYEEELDGLRERDPLMESAEAQMIAVDWSRDLRDLKRERDEYRAGRRGSRR
jgi:hypothetical protein